MHNQVPSWESTDPRKLTSYTSPFLNHLPWSSCWPASRINWLRLPNKLTKDTSLFSNCIVTDRQTIDRLGKVILRWWTATYTMNTEPYRTWYYRYSWSESVNISWLSSNDSLHMRLYKDAKVAWGGVGGVYTTDLNLVHWAPSKLVHDILSV